MVLNFSWTSQLEWWIWYSLACTVNKSFRYVGFDSAMYLYISMSKNEDRDKKEVTYLPFRTTSNKVEENPLKLCKGHVLAISQACCYFSTIKEQSHGAVWEVGLNKTFVPWQSSASLRVFWKPLERINLYWSATAYIISMWFKVQSVIYRGTKDTSRCSEPNVEWTPRRFGIKLYFEIFQDWRPCGFHGTM